MILTAELSRRRAVDDAGFTLLEVIVSVVLMGVVMAGVGAFFVKGVATGTGNDRRSAAVALADQTMEVVRSVPPLGADGIESRLVSGRSAVDTTAQWAAATAPTTELSDSAPAFSASAVAGAAGIVPFSQSFTVGTQDYDVQTFIGTCYRTNATTAQCTKTDPGPSAGATRLFRVVVQVIWDQGAGRDCSGRLCQYVVSTLIDPSDDPLFNSNTNLVLPPTPVADNDSATTPLNTAVNIDVLAGDTGDLPPAPVTVVSGGANGTVTGAPNSPLRYTPNAGFAGTDTFSYTVTDLYDRTSNVATVTVTVQKPSLPVAVNDTVSVNANQTVSFNVLSNDGNLGYATTVTPTALTGVGGTRSASGGVGGYSYTAPATGGTASFTYTVTDSYGQVSNVATVTITVVSPKPTVPSRTVCRPNQGFGTQTVTVDLLTGQSPSGSATISNLSTNSVLWSVSGPSGGSSYTFSGGFGGFGTAITYRVTVNGQQSDPITITIPNRGVSC